MIGTKFPDLLRFLDIGHVEEQPLTAGIIGSGVEVVAFGRQTVVAFAVDLRDELGAERVGDVEYEDHVRLVATGDLAHQQDVARQSNALDAALRLVLGNEFWPSHV